MHSLADSFQVVLIFQFTMVISAIAHFQEKGLRILCPNTPMLCNATMFEPYDEYNVDLLAYLVEKQKRLYDRDGTVIKIHVYRNVSEREFQYHCIGTTDGLIVAQHCHLLFVNKAHPMQPAETYPSDHLNYYIGLRVLKNNEKRKYKNPYILGEPEPEDHFKGLGQDPMPGAKPARPSEEHAEQARKEEAALAKEVANEILGLKGRFSWREKIIEDVDVLQVLNAIERNEDGTLTIDYPIAVVTYPSVTMTPIIQTKMEGNVQSVTGATVVVRSSDPTYPYEETYHFKPEGPGIFRRLVGLFSGNNASLMDRFAPLPPREPGIVDPPGPITVRKTAMAAAVSKYMEDFVANPKASKPIYRILRASRSQIAPPPPPPEPKRYKYTQLRTLFCSNVTMIGKQLVIYDSITRNELATMLKNTSKLSKKDLFSRNPVSQKTMRMEFTLPELMRALNARVIVYDQTRLWMIDQSSVNSIMIKAALTSRGQPTTGSKTVLFDRLYDFIQTGPRA